MSLKKLIILDRDGVINKDSDAYIKSPEEWSAIPGSLEAIAKLNRANYLVTVATNQSGVARGYFDLAMLENIHQKMLDELKKVGGHIDSIHFCPHGPDDNCDCRKPKPGLIKDILKKYPTPATEVIVIGDSLRDLTAAQKANCTAVLVTTGKGKKTRAENQQALTNIPIFENLASFVDNLLSP